MELYRLIRDLEELPKDKLLYDSICRPTWYQSEDGMAVLAGAPCPIQTVEQLLHSLKSLMMKDLPSQDNTFRRKVYDNTEVYYNSVKTSRNGLRFVAEEINSSTIKSWFNHSTDTTKVIVAIGGPSYMLSSDKVEVLVNKTYFRALGLAGKRNYLEELLTIRAFQYQDTDGNTQYFNKEYWGIKDVEPKQPDYTNHSKPMGDCGCGEPRPKPAPKPQPEAKILVTHNSGGFDFVEETDDEKAERERQALAAQEARNRRVEATTPVSSADVLPKVDISFTH
jgi:hypothetical protein|nr:MAG TPA: hypothetical protein [Caudoviricetes sp.]